MAVLVLRVTGHMKEQIQKVLIIIRTLNSMGTSRSSASETGLANTSYENELNSIASNPILVARHSSTG